MNRKGWGEACLGRLVASNATQESLAVALVERDTASTPTPSAHGIGSIRPAAVQAGGSVVDDGSITNAFLSGQPYGTVSCIFDIGFHLVLLVTTGVICGAGADYTVRDSDNHSEPDDGQHLQRYEEGQEDPLDSAVHADGVLQAAERREQVCKSIRVAVGAGQLATRIAAIGHLERHVHVD